MINRELFTWEDLEKIDALSAKGEWDRISSAILIDTPQKEHALNLYLLEHKPIVIVDTESAVRKAAAKKESKGKQIETPEEEAALQAEIDAEKEILHKKRKKATDEKREELKKELEKSNSKE